MFAFIGKWENCTKRKTFFFPVWRIFSRCEWIQIIFTIVYMQCECVFCVGYTNIFSLKLYPTKHNTKNSQHPYGGKQKRPLPYNKYRVRAGYRKWKWMLSTPEKSENKISDALPWKWRCFIYIYMLSLFINIFCNL